MRLCITLAAVALLGLLAGSKASACDYNRAAVIVQAVPSYGVQTFAVPSYGVQAVAVVPHVQSFAVVQKVAVLNHGYGGFQVNAYGGFRNNGLRGGFRGNGFRQQNAGGTGVVGLARGVVNTAGNVLGAVIGR
jgi:hypothetical protein